MSKNPYSGREELLLYTSGKVGILWHFAKRVLKRKIWKLSGRLSVFFLQFVQGMKAMRGRGWKLCTHSAGSVTWGPGSSHHSCSTPTCRHRARYIKYARQLQYEQTLANFSAMCCRVGEEHLHRSISGFLPARIVTCLIDVLDGAVSSLVPCWDWIKF